jgi:hypothetical protein
LQDLLNQRFHIPLSTLLGGFLQEAAIDLAVLANPDNRPPMRTFSYFFIFIVRFDLEAEFASIHFEELRTDGDLLAFRRSREVFHIHFKAHCGMVVAEDRLHRLNTGSFHQANHRWSRKHTFSPRVFDHETIVYDRRDFGLESGFETFKVHVISPFG